MEIYDIMEYADCRWRVIASDGDLVTLLAQDDVFGEACFSEDRRSNSYRTSHARKHLRQVVLPILTSRGVNPIPTRLPDVGVTDKVWLLSADEATSLPDKIREFPRPWWLRTEGFFPSLASYVDSMGIVSKVGYGVLSRGIAIRPAIRVKVGDSIKE